MKWLLSLFSGGASTGWFVASAVLVLACAGGAGMWGGYEIASSRYSRTISEIKDAHIDALEAKNELLLAEQRRGNEIAQDFLDRLSNIRIENRTFNQQVRVEREKLVYTDCVVPESGVDLLNRHIDATNLRLIGSKKE